MDKNEIETRPDTKLPDAEDLKLGEELSEKEKRDNIVTLWTKRFTQAEAFRRPYIEKNLRMYKLYRAYREAVNYAYGTNLMPPTGFEIIETVKPRLASAKIKVNIYPTKKEDLNNPSIDRWDDLVAYDLQVTGFEDKKIEWINAMLMYGNGVMQIMWTGRNPEIEVVDNWLFYPDPKAGKRLKNSRWEIKQSFKSKAQIEKEEKKRGDNPLYIYKGVNDKGESVEQSIIYVDAEWKEVNDEQPKADDPRRQRYEINTKKMGQIDDGRTRGQATNESNSSTPDKDVGERLIEIWECWDHIEGKLQVVFNRIKLARDEDNPYAKINNGQVFIDFPDISLNWEYYAMSHLEPVETTIHEIADSRNQAMDDIVFALDPIRKVRKGKGYKTTDLKHSPGATWYLEKADDVVFMEMPEVSRAWVEKDGILRREIQTSLALSEYTQGLPKSGTEPASKVEILLMQTNIRFSLTVRQMEIAMTELVNSFIQMNQEWLDEDMSFRLLGKDFRFGEFKSEDKNVIVDAYVDIEPDQEKTAEQKAKEVMELYKMFVAEDKPEGGTPEEIETWKRKKATLQKLIVRNLGYEEFEDILAPEYKKPEEKPVEATTNGERPPVAKQDIQVDQGVVDNNQSIQAEVPQTIPLLTPEGNVAPQDQAQKGGILSRLLQGLRRNK